MVISSTAFRRSARLVALGFGLDFFPVQSSSGIFCFLHAFSGDYVGGDRSLAVHVGRLGHELFYADGSTLMTLSLMFSSASVLESGVSLSAPDVSKVSAVSPGLQPPIWLLEVGGLFCPSEVVQMVLLSSVTAL
jgi:hypothetical protein